MKTIASRILITSMLALGALSLVSCQQKTPHELVPPNQQDLLSEIEAANVQVIQQGSRLQIILPTDHFFKWTTTNIKDSKIPVLQMIALYLHNFASSHTTHYPIKISAYTDTVYMRSYRRELSNQYAEVIAAFMWSRGFSPKEMQVVGYGALYPLASNVTARGSAFNRRVMIQIN